MGLFQVLLKMPSQDMNNNDVTDDEISVEEVKSAINGLKKYKAPGIDTLDPPVYKSFTEPLINHLTMLYNQVLTSGEYPSTWSVGKIKPIFKNGSKSDPNNYRGISLLNVMAKLFSIIINRRLEWWVEINGVLNDSIWLPEESKNNGPHLHNELLDPSLQEEKETSLCLLYRLQESI